jgi:hypothetical protein
LGNWAVPTKSRYFKLRVRWYFAFVALAFCNPAISAKAQQALLPLGFDRVAFFGDILARMSFCGMYHDIDEYELASAMKAFGVTPGDRALIENGREKYYQSLREKFKTARDHADFCIENRNNPFFVKAGRKGSPTIVGSDDRRQPEKIEVFGDLLGAMLFCKIDVSGDKWGKYLFDMGVNSESIQALSARAKRKQQALVEAGQSRQAEEFCQNTRSSPYLSRFGK